MPDHRTVRLSPETRAKIAASQTLHPPHDHVDAILQLYATMSLNRTADRAGYDRKVVRRVLHQAGVPIRSRGRPRRHDPSGLLPDGQPAVVR